MAFVSNLEAVRDKAFKQFRENERDWRQFQSQLKKIRGTDKPAERVVLPAQCSKTARLGLQQLVEAGCDKKLILNCCKYLAKPKKNFFHRELPGITADPKVLASATRAVKEALKVSWFDPDIEAEKQRGNHLWKLPQMLEDFGKLLEKAISLDKEFKKHGPKLLLLVLASHVKSKTRKAQWRHLQKLVEAFAGEERRALKQDLYEYKKNHRDLVPLASFMLSYLTDPDKSPLK